MPERCRGGNQHTAGALVLPGTYGARDTLRGRRFAVSAAPGVLSTALGAPAPKAAGAVAAADRVEKVISKAHGASRKEGAGQ